MEEQQLNRAGATTMYAALRILVGLIPETAAASAED